MGKESNSGGISSVSILTIAFVVLKLCNVITWSWWWVLSPIWITAALVIVVIGVYLLVLFIKQRPNKNPKHNSFEDVPKVKLQKSKFMEKLEEAMKEKAKQKEQ